MAATVYVIRTNGVEYGTTFTNKARALSEAGEIVRAAHARCAGDVVTVSTQKTGKIVFEYVAPVASTGTVNAPMGDESTPDVSSAHTGTEDVVEMIPAGPVMVPVVPVQMNDNGMPDMGIYGATLEESGVSIGVVSKRSKTAHFIVEGTNAFCGKTVEYVNGVSRDAAITSGVNVCGICRTAQRVQWEHYNAARVKMLATMTGDAENGAQSVSEGNVTVVPMADVDSIRQEMRERDALPLVIDSIPALATVEIRGDEPNTWAPDFSAATARECYFGCGVAPVAVFVDYVGRTEGLCAEHRNRAESTTYDVPDNGSETDIKEEKNMSDSPLSNTVALVKAIQGGAVPTAGVVQNRAGMSGVTHYHSPVCRDVAREMKRYGQSKADVHYAIFSSVAEILAFEYGDIASDNCETDSLEWVSEILMNARIDSETGIRIMGCLDIPMGEFNGIPLEMVNGEYRLSDAPRIHAFPSTSEAYDASQCSDSIRDGDVLTVPSESVVGILVKAWPCAITEAHGEFHGPLTTTPAEFMATQGAEYGRDYSASLALAESAIRTMREAEGHAFNTCDIPECGQCAEFLHNECKANHTDGTVCKACEEFESAQGESDAGFVEVLTTKEYDLSVIVDDITGATVSLGWVTLTLAESAADDLDAIADAYGKAHGSGTPRDGWASIIIVHDVCDI